MDSAATTETTDAPPAPSAPFGTVFGELMSLSRYADGTWSEPVLSSIHEFGLHPGTHALHYGSSCFEGLKAHRRVDGSVAAFRPDAHARRFRQSAARLVLPIPEVELTERLIAMAVNANAAITPASPGSLYLRPTLLGTDVTIGAAAHPSHSAVLYVLACPVGEYLPPRPLTIAVETVVPRTTPQFGVVKTGANYAMALGSIEAARQASSADQVLFAPGGVVQETGASNVLLLDGEHLVTPALTDSFLHGVTRDSLLQVARSIGWTVDEREVTVDDCIDWAARPGAEIGLMGTAAVMASVGTLVVDGVAHVVGGGAGAGSAGMIDELRRRLVDIQSGVTSFDFS
jgi:branched-chain amino acid aminotransferase